MRRRGHGGGAGLVEGPPECGTGIIHDCKRMKAIYTWFCAQKAVPVQVVTDAEKEHIQAGKVNEFLEEQVSSRVQLHRYMLAWIHVGMDTLDTHTYTHLTSAMVCVVCFQGCDTLFLCLQRKLDEAKDAEVRAFHRAMAFREGRV